MDMRLRVQPFMAVAWLALLECLRQPVVLLVTVSVLTFTALLPLLITHVLGDGQRIVRDSGLALHLMSGMVLGAHAACASLRDEVRRGTASAVLSKPVGRAEFLLAKFSGLAAVMLLFSALQAAAVVLASRTAAHDYIFDFWGSGPLLLALLLALLAGGIQNYRGRHPFCSRTFGALLVLVPLALLVSGWFNEQGGRAILYASALPLGILPASALLALAILILTGLSVSLATRLEVVPTLACCMVLLMAGMMADYLIGAAAATHRGAALLYGILPNFQHFWATDALVHGAIPWRYVGQAALYGACYTAGILTAGAVAFRSMELRG